MIFRRTLWVVLAAVLLAAIPTFGQSRTNRLYRPCPGSTTPAVIEVQRDGDIDMVPCSGRSVLVNGSNIAGGVQSVTLAASQNNLTVGPSLIVRFDNSTGGLLNVTGLAAGGQADGTYRWLVNKGTSSILLSGEGASSLAANRFFESYLLDPKSRVLVIYNGSRWEVFN